MANSKAARLSLGAQVLVLGVIFLVPVTAWPWTVDAFETNKQLVLVLGATLAASMFMLSKLLERRSMTWPSLLSLLPLGLLIVTALSAVFSLAPMTSWLGQGAGEYVSVLTLVAFLCVFYAIGTGMRSSNFRWALLLAMFAASSLVAVSIVPGFFGLNIGIWGNLVGAPHAGAVFLIVMATLACGLWLVDFKLTQVWQNIALRIMAGITYAGCVLMLLALDSLIAWSLSLFGALILFAIALVHADRFRQPGRFVPMMTLFTLSIIFLFLPTNFPSPFFPEVSPNLSATWGVINGAWSEGSIVFGTGPGTFSLAYSKYAPLDINQTEFWDLIFDRGNAHVSTLLATTGLVGVLAWLVFVIVLMVQAGKRLLIFKQDWQLLMPVYAAWLLLVVAAFMYTQNMTLSMLFWALSGVLLGLLTDEKHSLRQHARAHLATVFVAMLVFVCTVTSLFVIWPRYAADVAFAKALKKDALATNASEVDEVIRLIDKAAATNPWNDTYSRNLAGSLLRRVSLLSSEEAANNEYVQSLLATTISAATRATDISPLNLLNWEVRGLVYRELLPVIPQAAQPAVTASETVVELAPTNPRYRVAAAQAHMAIADAQNPLLENTDQDIADQALSTQTLAMAKAEEHLRVAIALKSDYAPAHYTLALLKQSQGKLAEAVRGLEYVKMQIPEDVGVGLKLGLLYLQQGKNEQAQVELQRVLTLAPAYADAHWYLSVVFEQKGDLANAISEVEKVLDTNPDNVTVQTRLDRLKAGQTSNVIPEPPVLTAP